jgi:uncharacterized protein YndB with AHSA1/START domain
MLGTLEQASTGWRLRFTRELAHPADRVWRAVTEAEHLQAWFPMRIHGDWVVGGPLTFSDPDGRGLEFTGKVLAYQPPSVLEFSWGPDVLRLEIEPRGAGCTLTLLDTFDELGKAARDAAGWHVCLDLLAAHLDGAGQAGQAGPTWSEIHQDYVAALGPEAATIGPPPGYGPDDNG